MRFFIYIEPIEHTALMQLAQTERRDPRQQAALLIRQRLEQLGLLPAPTPPAPALEVKP
jgi:hypothetical protein